MAELEFSHRISNSLRASTSTPARIFSVISISIITLLLLGFTADIPWNIETISAGGFSDAFFNSIANLSVNGYSSFFLSILYSAISGVALTNIGILLKQRNISKKGIGGILPGFVATGCASCGVGIAGILGFTGLAASLPFQGDLFRIGGILILVYALYEMGDPEVCRV